MPALIALLGVAVGVRYSNQIKAEAVRILETAKGRIE